MNLTFHQFRTDVRHFRWRLLWLWLSFAAGPVLPMIHSLPGMSLGISSLLLGIWQAFFGLAIVASLVQADPFVGTGAGWLTRPLRRKHLFQAKSAFIILCLLAPSLAFQGLGWILRGYSLHLGWVAAEQSFLFSATFVLVVAVLAALTRDLAQFFLAAGITIGGIFVWTVTVDMLVHAGVLHKAFKVWQQEAELEASALTVAYLVLMTGALAAWLWQARAGRWRLAVGGLAIGLLAFPVINTVWSKNFLAPKTTTSAPLALTLLGSHQPGSGPQNQLLSSEFLLSGVPAGQVAVIQDIFATARFNGNPANVGIAYPPQNSYQGRIRPPASQQQNNYFSAMHDFFPSNTLWFNDDFYGWVGSAFDSQSIFKRFKGHPPAAQVNGTLTVDLYGVKKVAEEPLQFGSFLALPGVRVTVQKVVLADGVISVSLDECSAQLLLDRDVDTASHGNSVPGPFCTYVLYHPGSGEAFIVSQRNATSYFPAFLSGEAHQYVELHFPYPALRERLAGIPAMDWLREARLCVFAPVYAGTSQLVFHQDNYHWLANRSEDVRQQKETTDSAQAIANATLPINCTEAQLNAYLDKILLVAQPDWDDASHKTVRKKLAAIGTNGLPALIRRLPLARDVEALLVFPVLNRPVTRDQLPDLRAALQRDNNVVELFVEKHWEADARDILLAKLSDHRQPLPSAALCIAAAAKDPATYTDLRWQFVHLENGRDEVIAALKQCPGFDTAGAVREAWQYARLGVTDPGDLAVIAAIQGLPDALNQAVIQAENEYDPPTQQRELAELAWLTDYHGPTNDILPWLTANLGRLRYDPAQQRYQ